MSKEFICKACGNIVKPKTMVKGSGLVELFLWFLVLLGFLFFPLVFLFFLMAIIYSVWRSSSRYKACWVCKSKEIIPVDSPIGQKLLAENQTSESQE